METDEGSHQCIHGSLLEDNEQEDLEQEAREKYETLCLQRHQSLQTFCFSNVNRVGFGPSLNISTRIGTQTNMVTSWFPSLIPFFSAFCCWFWSFSFSLFLLFFLLKFSFSFLSFSLFSNLTNTLNCCQKYTILIKFRYLKMKLRKPGLCRKQDTKGKKIWPRLCRL